MRRREDLDEFAETRDRMDRVGEVLRDPDRTAFRVVTIPETMAVRESERLVSQLRGFEVPVTTLVVNKVIEDAGDCERCRGKQAVHEESVSTLETALPELPVWTVPDRSGEVTGLAALESVAETLPVGGD